MGIQKNFEIVASTKGFNAYVTRSKREQLNKTTTKQLKKVYFLEKPGKKINKFHSD